MTKKKPLSKEYIGQDFDEFLAQEGVADEVEARAIKKVISALVLGMGLTQVEIATRLQTSRTQVKRLLDPNNTSITLSTLQKTANIAGHRVVISFEPLQRQKITPSQAREIA